MAASASTLRFSRLNFQLVVSYLASTSALMTSSAAQLITFAILARSLGVEQFGLLITVTVVTNIAVQICSLGANESLLRRVAAEPALYATALGHALILLLGTGLVLTVLLALGLPYFVSLSADATHNALALLSLAFGNIVLVRLVLLVEQVFIARWQMGRANAVNIAFALARTAAAAIACGVFHVDTAVAWAFWSAGSLALMALAALAAIAQFGPPRWTIMREEVPLGLYFTSPFVFRALRQNADTLVLGAVASAEVVGAYNMARRVVETSILTTEALHRLIYPRLARRAAEGYRAVVPMIAPVTAAAVTLGTTTALGLYLIAPLMPLVFGKSFVGMIDMLRTICWVFVFVSLHDVAGQVLGATGRHGIRASIYNIGNLAGALASVALTYSLQLTGTYVALFATEAVLAVAFWIALALVIRRATRA